MKNNKHKKNSISAIYSKGFLVCITNSEDYMDLILELELIFTDGNTAVELRAQEFIPSIFKYITKSNSHA